MTGEEIRPHIRAQAFRPFILCLADGRRVPVMHHDFILISPNGRLVHVDQPDNSVSIIDVLLVLSLDFPAISEPAQNPSTNGP